jgi:hypothetical protein
VRAIWLEDPVNLRQPATRAHDKRMTNKQII